MICHNCLRQLARQRSSLLSRSYSISPIRLAPPVTAQTTTITDPRPNDLPAATSTSAAQPFSTPLTPAAARSGDNPSTPAPKVTSSVPAGTFLKGLNYEKNKQDPVALEDHEYPAWLWDVLNEQAGEKSAGSEGEGDLFSKSKKQRRLAAKALKKQQLLHPESLAPKVPLYEQSIDLPKGDGTVQGASEAAQARLDLTRAMRGQRRAKIKEGNFLKEMR